MSNPNPFGAQTTGTFGGTSAPMSGSTGTGFGGTTGTTAQGIRTAFTGTTAPGSGSTTAPLYSGTTGAAPAMNAFQQAVPVQHFEKAPVMHERYRREEVEEVQPIIHREHERTEVHQVIQPIYEGQVSQVQVSQRELPAQVRATREAPAYVSAPAPVGTRQFAGVQHVTVQRPVMVEDSEKRKIIEEVQPVIYKEVVQPALIKETLPIYERVVEPYTVTREVRAPIYKTGSTPATTTALPATTTNMPPSTGMGTGMGTGGGVGGMIAKAGEKLAEKFTERGPTTGIGRAAPKEEVIKTTTVTSETPIYTEEKLHHHGHGGHHHGSTAAVGHDALKTGSGGQQVFAKEKL